MSDIKADNELYFQVNGGPLLRFASVGHLTKSYTCACAWESGLFPADVDAVPAEIRQNLMVHSVEHHEKRRG